MKTDWILTRESDLAAMCMRCGVIEPPPRLPIPVNEYVKWSGAFLKKHKGCKVKSVEVADGSQ